MEPGELLAFVSHMEEDHVALTWAVEMALWELLAFALDMVVDNDVQIVSTGSIHKELIQSIMAIVIDATVNCTLVIHEFVAIIKLRNALYITISGSVFLN